MRGISCRSQREKIRFVFFSVCVGGAIGAFIWLFLEIMEIGQGFLFEFLSDAVDFPYLVPVLCVVGGLLIGLAVVWREYWSGGKAYRDYCGLCFWAGSRCRYVGAHMEELSQISLGAALGVIFRSSLFGLMLPVEEEIQMQKTSRTVAYICSILGGVGAFFLLGRLIGGGAGIPTLEGEVIGNRERIFVIVLIPFGLVAGFLYMLVHNASSVLFGALKKTGDHPLYNVGWPVPRSFRNIGSI